jgi:DNA-binding NtrC family response regulator
MEDIKCHVGNTLAALAEDGNKAKLSAKDYKALNAYDWPGNVRQLMKIVKRSVYLAVPVVKVIDGCFRR